MDFWSKDLRSKEQGYEEEDLKNKDKGHWEYGS
ncbi:hypothetical protein SAMN05421821_10916 [Mucilaginibacter lappiensis]|uniref:Uncharacterized protein n=1 Tax=Mucilaginibacter lappiensis TaxID=354630 RepID=A0A1N7C6V6_9SPHI|nr:hypothetical protein [Mucilaginibacter lappiensis]MBB6127989.1 hypothetical protein [Mucilaginibacter lappiensis]SIR59318.1 hypothetical protein SAMN05421821_10916 [Mucilaginibacter lappiensis]